MLLVTMRFNSIIKVILDQIIDLCWHNARKEIREHLFKLGEGVGVKTAIALQTLDVKLTLKFYGKIM